MKFNSVVRIVALLVVVALAVPALAKPVSRSISLPVQAKIGGTVLDSGTYQFIVDGTTVTVKKGKQVLAQVQGEWERRDRRQDYTSVLLGTNGELQEIRFQGEKKVLVIRGQ
jgi:hypothetical protein